MAAVEAFEAAMVAEDEEGDGAESNVAVAEMVVAAAKKVSASAEKVVAAAKDVGGGKSSLHPTTADAKAGVSVDEACCTVMVSSKVPGTVAFFKAAAEASNVAVGEVAVAMLDALAASFGRYTETTEHSRERSAVLELLQALESGRRTDVVQLIGAVEAGTGRVVAAVGSEGERAAAAQQREMAQLMGAIETTLRGALEQVSTDAIVRRVGEAVQSAVRTEVAEVREGQREQRVQLSGLERGLREELQARVVDPIAARHEQVAALLAVLPERVASACAVARGEQDVMAGLGALRGRLEEVAGQHGLEMAAVSSLVSNRVLSEVAALRGQFTEQGAQLTKHLPVYVSQALSETLNDIQERGAVLQSKLEGAQDQLKGMEAQARENSERLSAVEKGGDSVLGKVDGLTQQVTALGVRQTSHLRAKGVSGEQRLYELLSERLRLRDGYVVEVVAGQSHGCDLVVRRTGYTDVRIESKVYADKVGVKEVEKFRRDLMGLNAHGVFVSVQSGVVGMGEVELEQMASGRFAVYLSNNQYNVSLVVDMIALMYKLDRLMGGGVDEEVAVRVPSEVMREVQQHVQDFAHKVSKLKVNMRESMVLLNQLALDHVVRLLHGCAGGAERTRPPPRAASVQVQERESQPEEADASAAEPGASEEAAAEPDASEEAAAQPRGSEEAAAEPDASEEAAAQPMGSEEAAAQPRDPGMVGLQVTIDAGKDTYRCVVCGKFFKTKGGAQSHVRRCWISKRKNMPSS